VTGLFAGKGRSILMRIQALWRLTGKGSQIQSGRWPAGNAVQRSLPQPQGAVIPTWKGALPEPEADMAGPQSTSSKVASHQPARSPICALS
jgi:hypothetical protein